MAGKRGMTSRSLTVVRKFFPKVTRVQDATRDVQVEVTDRDEKRSRRKDHNDCAMAVACKRAFDLDGVVISRAAAYLIKNGVATRYGLPQSVMKEVVSFDRGGGFAAGEYRLKPPDHKIGEPTRHPADYVTGERTGTQAKPRHTTTGIRARIDSR